MLNSSHESRISSSLTWKDQSTKVRNKAKHTLGLVKRTLHAADRSVRKTTYEMLVRPPLEYATCAWSPHTQKDKQCRENIQWAAARFVCSDYGKWSSITQMMDQLGWDRLTTRRLCRDATMLYKVVYSKVGIPLPDFIVRCDSRTGGANPQKFRTIWSLCVLYQTSFYFQTVTLWNLLPAPHCDGNHNQDIPGNGPHCFIPDVDCSADIVLGPRTARF